MTLRSQTIREATVADVPAMFHVRTSVTENHQSEAQLAVLGITRQTVAASLNERVKGWVAEEGDRVVGFGLADSSDASIFALFVLPAHERRGHGTRLLDAATAWLRRRGATQVRLDTGANTAAERFYRARGWRVVERLTRTNEVRMVLDTAPPDGTT